MNGFQWVAESAPLPGFVIRATVVLATGIALAWLMRKRSAQVRHRLWTATLLLLLLLPALTFWAPQWEMPLLPVANASGRGGGSQGVAGHLARGVCGIGVQSRRHGASACRDHAHGV